VLCVGSGESQHPRFCSALEFLKIASQGEPMIEGLFQPMHLLVIFGIALLVFGPKKFPELGKGIGEGIRGFKAAMKAEDAKPDSATANTSTDHGQSKG
jgi:sec-independent protein translocase protein TatA